jgi:hypothetical protein
LEEIDNADAFVKNLEKIELPTQLMAVMADPLLQKLLLLRPDAEGSSRISNWLMACLGDVASGDADSDIFLDMIEVINDYATATKVRVATPQSALCRLTRCRHYPLCCSPFLRNFLVSGTAWTSGTWFLRR